MCVYHDAQSCNAIAWVGVCLRLHYHHHNTHLPQNTLIDNNHINHNTHIPKTH